MHGNLSTDSNWAICSADQTVSESQTVSSPKGVTDQTVSEKVGWFVAMARALLPKDAGFALRCITGYEERSCYRYSKGDREAPADLLRNLVRSAGGEPFLNFIMDSAPWWCERQRQIALWKRKADLFDKFMREGEWLSLD